MAIHCAALHNLSNTKPVMGTGMDVWSIASVERDTGLSKELLRMWERRYGFPQPQRDAQGDRLYPVEQVERLRLLKRLLDSGHRPGKLLALNEQQLAELVRQPDPVQPPSAKGEDELQRRLIALLIRPDVAAVRAFLEQELAQRGLRSFVLEVATATLRAVGEAWFDGRLAVHHEHLYSEELQKLLRREIHALPEQRQPPRILLTTMPNELHGLGLLMAEALLRLDGADVRSFGLQLPVSDIAAAAAEHEADVVGLSFSASFSTAVLRQSLVQLDGLLAPGIQLWVGGSAVRGMRKLPSRVGRCDTLDDLTRHLHSWRRAQAAAVAGR